MNMKLNPEMIELINLLIERGVLRTRTLLDAFMSNDRRDFVPEEFYESAYLNKPLSIGFGQTISQPYTMAFMMELLQPKSGDEVLDVGFGSGWSTSILAKIVGEKGRVSAVEIIPEIYKFGMENLKKYNYSNIEYHSGSWLDVPEQLFDCILVSAATYKSVVYQLSEKLKVGGRMVIPVYNGLGQSIKLIKKVNENENTEEDYPGFIFVPLV